MEIVYLFRRFLNAQYISKIRSSKLPEALPRLVLALLFTNFPNQNRTFSCNDSHIRCWILQWHYRLCLLCVYNSPIQEGRFRICQKLSHRLVLVQVHECTANRQKKLLSRKNIKGMPGPSHVLFASNLATMYYYVKQRNIEESQIYVQIDI